MYEYDCKENLGSRVSSLYDFGHCSSVWGLKQPPTQGHVIEIVAPHYVSKPCWTEISDAADFTCTVSVDFQEFVDQAEEIEQEHVYQFFFSNIDTAKKMALRVQKSARNIRKDMTRSIRLEEAGGFHNKLVLDQILEIQQGRCHYSGEILIKKPKNFVIDQITAIYLGGTNWPNNLALVIKEINTWKGGLTSSEDTLQWLAKKNGKDWLRKQKEFCKEVDSKRDELDKRFRLLNSNLT